MRAKSARTGFLQIAECDSALATDQNNKRRSRGLNPDCWTVAWTSRHYQLRWVLRHFSDKTIRSCESRLAKRVCCSHRVNSDRTAERSYFAPLDSVYTSGVRHASRRRHQDKRWFIVPCTVPCTIGRFGARMPVPAGLCVCPQTIHLKPGSVLSE